ncbi:ribonuclease HI family protein [bacterium]|nr:ribonuclease HI family protein [bacterium]
MPDKNMENEIIMFTDGGSRGNPGPSGIGVWISAQGGSALGGKTLDKKFGKYIGEKTNNEAEYEALLFGLKKLKSIIGKAKSKQTEIKCFLDSELIVKQLNHEYKLRNARIQKYFIEIWNLMLDFKKVSYSHIPREKNKIADGMVNEALDVREKQGKLL